MSLTVSSAVKKWICNMKQTKLNQRNDVSSMAVGSHTLLSQTFVDLFSLWVGSNINGLQTITSLLPPSK